MRIRRAALVAVTVPLMSLAASVTSPAADGPGKVLLADNFEGQPYGKWPDGVTRGAWRAVYDGYGTTSVEGKGRRRYLSMSPLSPAHSKETHGGLVISTAAFDDIDVVTQLWTIEQFRTTGNAWEVPWLLWNYTDDQHFYYIVLKPNGWELGKEDPAYPGAQRYLRTAPSPKFPVGTKHTVRVRQVGNQITVWGDQRLLTTYSDVERPYLRGSVGLYTEDAHVAFDVVVARRP